MHPWRFSCSLWAFDVLCEKPIAASSAEAGQMIEAAARNRRLLAVAQWCRFVPNFRLLQTLVHSGVLGVVEQIVANLAVLSTGRWKRPRTSTVRTPPAGSV
jgi:predicted dehydrogenase